MFEYVILQRVYFQNTVREYLIALAIFLVALAVFRIFQAVILARLENWSRLTSTDIDDTLIAVVRSIRPGLYSFLAFYIALRYLVMPAFLERIVVIFLVIWAVAQIVRAAQILIDYLVKKQSGAQGERGAQAAASALGMISKIILWSFALLFALSNIGVNITSLIAGLGIGGIAIAFALQNILADLFSSFAIYFDKPFVEGDFIIVGAHMGIVQHVGIKTTRIKALQGEEIIIANRELTSASIQNFKKMRDRRIVFGFGVTYDTPSDKIKQIPDIVRGIIAEIPLVRFDRAHFYRFGDSSLDFEVVYFVETGDYTKYMDIHQEIHLKIKSELDKLGIAFAFPTRTVHLEGAGRA